MIRTPGVCGSTGVHCSWLVASSGASASSKSGAPSLCTISSRSPAGSTSYSTPWRRGATSRGVPSGSAAGSSQYSLVSLLPTPSTIQCLVPAGPDPDPEPLVGLGQHLGVGADVGAEPVPQHHVRPPRRVGAGVEQVALAGPGDPVRDVGDLVGEQLAGGQVHDLEQEPLVPGDVGRVRQQRTRRRDREGAEGEELLALGGDVGVQQDLLAGDLARRRRAGCRVLRRPGCGSRSGTPSPRGCARSTSRPRRRPSTDRCGSCTSARSGRSPGCGP